jgi:hypothetical protein
MMLKNLSEKLPTVSDVNVYIQILSEAEEILSFLSEHFLSVFPENDRSYDLMYNTWKNAELKLNTDILP